MVYQNFQKKFDFFHFPYIRNLAYIGAHEIVVVLLVIVEVSAASTVLADVSESRDRHRAFDGTRVDLHIVLESARTFCVDFDEAALAL